MSLTDTIEIKGEFTAPKGQLLEKANAAFERQLAEQLGLTDADVKELRDKNEFEVSVTEHKGLEVTKSGPNLSDTLNAVLKTAKKADERAITVKFSHKVEAPYFNREIKAKGLGKEGILVAMAKQEEQLKGQYGPRVSDPDSVKFIAVLSKADYASSGTTIPDNLHEAKSKKAKGKILGWAESNVGIDDAIEKAQASAISKGNKTTPTSTVIYGMHKMRIYGSEETLPAKQAAPKKGTIIESAKEHIKTGISKASKALKDKAPAAAAPLVAASGRSYRRSRGGSPAGQVSSLATKLEHAEYL